MSRPAGNGLPVESHPDRRFLDTLEKKFQLVRDYTAGVAFGRTTGLYLYGVGGCGKSHTVRRELERLKVPYKAFNSRMTGRGLYNALEKFPDAVHVLEDMEQLFRESGARGVLRSALWGDTSTGRAGPSERLVTWTTYKLEHSFIFTGGIIMVGNRPFGDAPELDAIKTRIAYMHVVVSDNEMIALMRHVLSQGYAHGDERMDAFECAEVCSHIIEQCMGLRRLLDMRMLINSFQDYLQWRACETGCCWKDMVSTRVKERPTAFGEVRNATAMSAQKEHELAVAKELMVIVDRHERLDRWRKEVGKSEQSLYRRLAEVGTLANGE